MLQFSGEHDFNRPPAEVWAKLRDVTFLLSCIPDVQPGAEVEQDRAQFTIRPGFSFVRGKLDATMHIAEAAESEKLRFAVVSKGVGSSSEVQTDLHFTLKGEKTAVKWTADIKQLGGLLKAVPRGLIQAAAQKVIADVWANISTKLESEP
jgi:carbon monoxide dehydrogenase subunit G